MEGHHKGRVNGLFMPSRSKENWRTGLSLAAAVLVTMAGVFTGAVLAQEKCLQPGKAAEIRKQVVAETQMPEDAALKEQLVAAGKVLAAAEHQATIGDHSDKGSKEDLRAVFEKTKSTQTALVCSILNERGWPMRSAVGAEGSDSFLFLIAKALPVKMQLELYPIVYDAFAGNEIDRGELIAVYIDRLRLAIGQKQLFGTQVYVRDGFLVLAPIDRPDIVEERRAEFRLQPLRSYERFLEISYRMPLIRSVMEPIPAGEPKEKTTNTALTSPALADETEAPVIKIETAFVSVDVVVPDAADTKAANLEKGDFRIFENDKPVEITNFAKTDAPFDIVLLLDLSGSTAEKVGLIRKTTKRFVEMKRPIDRVAVVSFHDTQTVVSDLESNKEILLERIKKIEGRGASRIWDALTFGMDLLDKGSEKGRRRAIVLMSDGADNSLTYFSRLGSRVRFADLVERVQRSTTAIFPIYLDTEGKDQMSKKVYADARLTLGYLADQSAGNMYYAKRIDDLSSVYDRVLKDVGTVYSLGFSPDDEGGATKWRTLRVEVPSHPGLKIKHRPGYFVK